MSSGKQGIKTGRKERHQASQRSLKERKKLRRQRADIHRAMTQAETARKAKKKGRDQFDRFMLELGYAPKSYPGYDGGRDNPGDVTDKYEVIA
jgi:hypothetical protein